MSSLKVGVKSITFYFGHPLFYRIKVRKEEWSANKISKSAIKSKEIAIKENNYLY